MKQTLAVVFCVCCICLYKPALAWDANGHRIVADIAKRHLDKSVLDSVEKYLGGTSFEDAATWMDEVRKEPSYDYMKPWHYVNIEKDNTYVATNAFNIINQLEKAIGELNERNKHSVKDIRMDIKIIFHLVGDIHQPLHAGYGEDKGGNDIRVQIMSRNTNLHRVWDTDLLEAKRLTADDCERLAETYSTADVKNIGKVDVMGWVKEDRDLLPQIYDFKDGTIGKDYINKKSIVALRRLTYAGLRLAAILNEAFRKQI